MDYKNYHLEDFLTDDFFVNWVKEPNYESNRFWRQWLSENPTKKDLASEAAQIILTINYEEEYKLDEQSRSEMINNILQKSKNKHLEYHKVEIYATRRIAAIITFFLLAGAAWWFLQNDIQKEEQQVASVVSYISKSTQAGQKLSLTLPDGSKIKLNSEAKVSFPENFNDSIRLVQVHEGEVFFDVVKNAQKPFIVKTNNIDTRVLGTSFNVNYQKEKEALEVALVTGKVQVTKEDLVYYLLPKEKIAIRESKVLKSNFDIRKVTGWKDGILIIEDRTFKETISILENWYGVSIKYKSDNDGIYNGIFKNESLENVLDGLGFTTDFKHSIEDKNVILK